MTPSEAMRVPQLPDIERAVRIYWSKNVLRTADVTELFGVSKSKAHQLMRYVREYQREHNIHPTNPRNIYTECAFATWNLDIGNLEKRLSKLQMLSARSPK